MHQPLFCLARIDIRFAKALTKLSLAARLPLPPGRVKWKARRRICVTVLWRTAFAGRQA
jgi:hypothetical protein